MPSPKKPAGPVIVPPNAATWTLAELYTDEKGKSRRRACKTPPLEDGSVPESWAASEFSERNVLDTWGGGRYRVDFYDAKDEHCSGMGRVFEVAKPTGGQALKRKKRRTEDLDEDEDRPLGRVRPLAAGGGAAAPMSLMDYLTLQRQEQKEQREREERLAERARGEAREQRESDRQFFTTIVGLMKGGGGGDFNPDILRRELALEMREGISGIRRDLASDLGRRPDTDGDDDDDDKPPKDIGEAGNRIVLGMLGELEERAPELLNEAIPTIVGWMRSKGIMPSPKLQAEIEEHRAAQNGRGGSHA